MVATPSSAYLQADGEGNFGIHGAKALPSRAGNRKASSLDLSLVRLVPGTPGPDARHDSN
jgi:hypothetical protein